MTKLTYLTLAAAMTAIAASPAFAQKAPPPRAEAQAQAEEEQPRRRGGRLFGALVGAARIYGAVEGAQNGGSSDVDTALSVLDSMSGNTDSDAEGEQSSALVALGEATGVLDEDDAALANALMPLVDGDQSQAQSKSNEKSLQERPRRNRPTRATRTNDETTEHNASQQGGGIFNAGGTTESRALLLPAVQAVRAATENGESVDTDHSGWVDVLSAMESAEPQDRAWLRAQLIAAGVSSTDIGDWDVSRIQTRASNHKSLQERPRRQRPTRTTSSAADRDVSAPTEETALLLPAVQAAREAARTTDCSTHAAADTHDGCQMCPPGQAAATAGDANLDGDFDAEDLGNAAAGGTEDINIGIGELQECSNPAGQEGGGLWNADANANPQAAQIGRGRTRARAHVDPLYKAVMPEDDSKSLQERPRRERPTQDSQRSAIFVRGAQPIIVDNANASEETCEGKAQSMWSRTTNEAASDELQECSNTADREGGGLWNSGAGNVPAAAKFSDASSPYLVLNAQSESNGQGGGGVFNNGGTHAAENGSVTHTDRMDGPADDPLGSATAEDGEIVLKASDEGKSLQERPRRQRPTRQPAAPADREDTSSEDEAAARLLTSVQGPYRLNANDEPQEHVSPVDALLVINQASEPMAGAKPEDAFFVRTGLGEALTGDAEITLKAGIAPEDEPQAATTVEMLVMMAADEDKAEDDSKSLQERPRRARPTRTTPLPEDRDVDNGGEESVSSFAKVDGIPGPATESGEAHLDYLIITMDNAQADGETCEEAAMSGGAGDDIFHLGAGDDSDAAETRTGQALDIDDRIGGATRTAAGRMECSNNLKQLG